MYFFGLIVHKPKLLFLHMPLIVLILLKFKKQILINSWKKNIWTGFVIMDLNAMPNKNTINFNCGKVEGVSVDTGGHTHYYLQNEAVKIKYIDCIHSDNFLCQDCQKNRTKNCFHNIEILQNIGFKKEDINFIQSGATNFEFLLKNTFLHYRGGGNWDNQSNTYHNNKTALLNDYIKDITI